MNLRIISGGQTGVDRAALDFAILADIEHGGYCPKGRKSEDGTIPDRYLLTEVSSASYPVRTKRNILASDATVVFVGPKFSKGTQLTIRLCRENQKFHIEIQPGDEDARIIQLFQQLHDRGATIINVAGPRLSSWQQGPPFVLQTLPVLLQVYRGAAAVTT